MKETRKPPNQDAVTIAQIREPRSSWNRNFFISTGTTTWPGLSFASAQVAFETGMILSVEHMSTHHPPHCFVPCESHPLTSCLSIKFTSISPPLRAFWFLTTRLHNEASAFLFVPNCQLLQILSQTYFLIELSSSLACLALALFPGEHRDSIATCPMRP